MTRVRLDDIALQALADQQDHVATLSQLEQLGIPAATACYRSKGGRPWTRLLPGVYLLQTGPPNDRQQNRAALLYAGDGAVITGVSAMVLYGFRYVSALPQAHVLVPHERRRVSTARVRVERTIRMPRPQFLHGLPVSPAARAVVDGARMIRESREIRAVVAEAIQRQFCSIEALAQELRTGQCRGTAATRAAFAEAHAGIRSVAESDLRSLMRSNGFPEPRWNVAIHDLNDKLVAVVDGLYEDEWVALEVDSREWHLSPDDWERTQRRHSLLTAAGLQLLHISPRRIKRDGRAVLDEIARVRTNSAGRPRPAVVLAPAVAISRNRERTR
jgi:very-short-patch-repair endonuclease